MNKIFLLGRLTKEPDMRVTPNSNKTVCQFTLAVDRPVSGEKKEADFINIVAWGKTAELCADYVSKGQRLLVEGRLQLRSYEKDGQRKYVTEVVADRVEFVEKKGNTDAGPMGGFGKPVEDSDVPF